MKYTEFQNQILSMLTDLQALSSSEIHEKLDSDNSYSTTKRMLTKLVNKKLIEKIGNRKGTKYKIGKSYRILHSININEYFEKDIDERQIRESFNFELIENELYDVDLFTSDELGKLDNLQAIYVENISHLTKNEYSEQNNITAFKRIFIDQFQFAVKTYF